MLAVRCLVPCALAAALAGQAPSPWAALPVPGGVVSGNLNSQGKLVVYRESNRVHVYSAFTRAWNSVPVTPGYSIRQTNDWLLIREAAVWTAFASMTGAFAPLAVSGAAEVVNPVSQRNDSLVLVRDGGALHAFSGFTGAWTSRAISPHAVVTVQRHVALLEDGSLVAGMSAFTGRWIDRLVAVPTVFGSANGTAAVAASGTALHGFSALRETWSTTPALAGPAAFVRNTDFALWRDATTSVAFSGLRGGFATAPVGATTAVATDELLAVLHDGATAHLYSAATGNWTSTPLSPAGQIRLGQAVALLSDGLVHTAFSATRGTLAAQVLPSSSQDATGSLAYVVDTATDRTCLYSAITGNWHSAPADARPGAPAIAQQMALLPTASGFRAFSARTGAFVPLSSANGVAVLASESSACLVWDQDHFHLFEPRRDVWLHHPRQSKVDPMLRLWRTSLVVIDGQDAVCFGTTAGRPWSVALPGPASGLTASSECGYVVTPSDLLAFGTLPEIAGYPQFPEFRRAMVGGADLRMWLRLPQGHAGFLGVGPKGASPTVFPGLGEVLLDLAGTVVVFVLPDPGAERRSLALPVPDDPALRGTEWFLQAAVLPPAGQPWIGEAAAVLVL
jgi:hypothetical protein